MMVKVVVEGRPTPKRNIEFSCTQEAWKFLEEG